MCVQLTGHEGSDKTASQVSRSQADNTFSVSCHLAYLFLSYMPLIISSKLLSVSLYTCRDMLLKTQVCLHSKNLIQRLQLSTPLLLCLCLVTSLYPVRHKSNADSSRHPLCSHLTTNKALTKVLCECVTGRDLMELMPACLSLTSDFD